MSPSEIQTIRDRYAERDRHVDRYDMFQPWVCQTMLERRAALIHVLSVVLKKLKKHQRDTTVLEVGCGHGRNLLELLWLGFSPENLTGNDLVKERLENARRVLPAALRLIGGDATRLDFGCAQFDVVFQSTVFSSILRDADRKALALAMWKWVKPGGGVLWYDFVYDNPHNPDVRGVPLRDIRHLFPEGRVTRWRVTLAPPLSRLLSRIHPALYRVANVLPLLRTHVMCWIAKQSVINNCASAP